MHRALLTSLLILSSACSEDLTEIVVVVTTDARVPDQLNRVQIAVTGPSGGVAFDSGAAEVTRTSFPLTLSLTPADALGPVSVAVTGTKAGDTHQIRRVTTTNFIEGRSLMLVMPIVVACLDSACGANYTCNAVGAAASCIPQLVDEGTLPAWTGMPPTRPDAGPPTDTMPQGDSDTTCTTAPCPCTTTTECQRDEICTFGVCVQGSLDGLAVGESHACGFFDGIAVCRGANSQGQLGNGSMTGSMTFVPVTGITDAQRISAGLAFTCVIRTGGRVACWGANESGQLGNMTTTASNVPTDVVDAAGVPLANATRLATGDRHACAIVNVMSRDRVFCWGDNARNQVVAGAGPTALFAVEQTGLTTPATRVTAGNGFSCAVAGGNVLCWGVNSAGQCGRGAVGGTCDTPTIVQDVGGARLSGMLDVAAGRAHACAINNTALLCWGDNANGQLGDGTTMARPYAGPVMNDRAEASVHAGANHTCAFAEGQLYCWGANASGQLFLPEGGNHPMPESVMASPIDLLHIWTGYFTSCVWETEGLRCAGTL